MIMKVIRQYKSIIYQEIGKEGKGGKRRKENRREEKEKGGGEGEEEGEME